MMKMGLLGKFFAELVQQIKNLLNLGYRMGWNVILIIYYILAGKGYGLKEVKSIAI